MYRDYKNRNLQKSNDTSLSSFMHACKEALDKIAALKQKYIRANNGPFMNKDITKAIKKPTRFRNNYLKHRCDANRYQKKKSLRFISKKS